MLANKDAVLCVSMLALIYCDACCAVQEQQLHEHCVRLHLVTLLVISS